MKIGGTNGVGGPQKVYPNQTQQTQDSRAAEADRSNDRVEISEAARLEEAISRVPDVRAEKVARAKAMIDSGELDTPENLDVAIDRMLDELIGE